MVIALTLMNVFRNQRYATKGQPVPTQLADTDANAKKDSPETDGRALVSTEDIAS